MNRIVSVTILSCVFLGTALLAQNSPQKPKTGPKPTATKPKPVAANGALTTGPGGLPLRGYKFDVVTVNSSGTVTHRRKGQARYYVEDISGVALEMVEISGGSFLMGSTDAGANQVKSEYERHGHNAEVASKQSRWEVPQHTVSVPTFYIGKFEVTQAQWRVVSRLPKVNKDLVSDPSSFKGDSLPVQQVSWEDAIEFCERLSRVTGRTYRLPTEAEWEYAARGGTTTAFYFGDTITPELVNYDGTYPYGSAPKGTNRERTTPVGSFGYPNALGLSDMHGNVWEWCMDYWHESYDGAPTDGSSWETGGDTGRRVLRGGSYYHDANHSRAAMRAGALAARGTPSTGFRVVAVARKPPTAAAAVGQVTIDDLMKYRNTTGVELSADGSRAVFVVTQPDLDANVMRSNLYLLDPKGAAIQLTNGPRHDEQPRWSPDGKWIAFISDRDAKPAKAAKRQVWVISPDGGGAWQLTRGTQTIVAVEWAPDGKHLAVIATEAPSDEEEKRTKDKDDAVIVDHDYKMGRIYLVSVPDGKAELLYAGDRHITSISFSPRGDEIAFADQPTPKLANFYLHSVISVINVGTRQVRVIAGAPSSNAYPQFSPDGSMVVFLGLSQTDLLAWRLYVVPVTGGASRRVAADVDEDVQGFRWADDSAALYFSASHGMDRHIYRAALDGKTQQVDRFPIGVARDFAIRNGKLAFVYESPSQGAEVYTATLGRGELAATKHTEMNPYLSDLSPGKTAVVRWKNKKDGMAMEGLLVTPPDYQPGKAYPLLVVIHGGPMGQFDTGFRLWYAGAYPVHVFASQGYVVFKPNPRGSGGWGAKFRKANLKDFGGADYHDIQDGVDELIARGIADRDHMGVMGWSYGGYMTAWTITQTSRFRAASVGAGMTNLYSMYGTTNFPFFFEWYLGGPPWQARELYVAHSPITFVDHIMTPTLIQHGTEDPGDPISQGAELYTALRARGIAVEMIRYPRSSHFFTEPRLIRDALTRNLEWFDRYVRGNAQAAKWHTPPMAAIIAPPAQ